ncbi:L-asparaginase [Bordetella trematum]|uniref:L-asparaginase II n=1 Tax=Bordetella trematum TaxID=123899 RepID=A0A157QZC1_9BORD|nr:asparaginase [Bordetella trematum]AUL45530.1 L-asparaginase [Bordetella trematum]AZR92325.1 L-asparaginase [Bordetella trematum]NNH20689.1 asparaginase [Bordetella trematum]SAI51050.1 L-asparaginase II [Bordetella trematum]SAI68393.1 L-asparaginase II [Bordetella trematum]
MPERPLPRIVLLATGGTIAGAQEQAASLSYRAASLGAQELLQAVPQLQALAQVDAEQLVSVGSQNMTYEVWHALAARIGDLQADPAVDGVVITHGTDTLEETAYFLSLVLPFGKPVVLVGAMRPATALSADGPRNLYNAVALAAHPDSHGRGPLVTLNDEIHYARDVQKMASIGVAAFGSPNAGRAGRVRGAEVVFHGERGIPSAAAAQIFPWPLPPARRWPRVEILYSCVDQDARLVDFMASYAQGIVLAGVGDGNTTDAALQALAGAAARGVAVVRSTRCGSGAVGQDVEVDDAAHGFVAAGELNPQKARVLLTLALMAGKNIEQIKRLFNKY